MKRKEVSVVAAMKGDKILWGKRRDNGKWTNPGGHLDPHEDPLDGAVRELEEETGISMPKGAFKHLETRDVKNNYRIHAYIVEIPENVGTSMKDDPDAEVERWHWMKLPFSNEVMKNLHSPDNVILQALGMQKTAFWIGFEKRAVQQYSDGTEVIEPDTADDSKRVSFRWAEDAGMIPAIKPINTIPSHDSMTISRAGDVYK
jgi:ADP-ribose pyrophosphatase YjhB (NUDIX family)